MEETKFSIKPSADLLLKSLNEGASVELYDKQEMTDSFKQKVCLPFLLDLYKKLSLTSSEPTSGIDRLSFLQYFKLPGIIGERIFNIFDNFGTKFIQNTSFISNMFKIYSSNFDVRLKFIFDVYDFNHDGKITREEVKTILTYIPINSNDNLQEKGTKSSPNEYEDVVQSQLQIDEMLDLCMKNKEAINFPEFKEINEIVSSDMFLGLYLFIRKLLPTFNTFNQFKSKNILNEVPKTPSNKVKVLASPKVLSRFGPISEIVDIGNQLRAKSKTSTSILSKFAPQSQVSPTSVIPPKMMEPQKKLEANKKVTEEDLKTPVLRKHNAKLNNCKVTISPSTKNLINDKNLIFCVCGRQVFDINNPICEICVEKEENSSRCGELLKYSTNKKQFINYWCVLNKESLFLYKNKCEESHKSLYILSHCFIECNISNPTKCSTDKVFPFKLINENKVKEFATNSLEEFQAWTFAIKNAIGYSSMSDYYKIVDIIGETKAGVVNKGIHLKSNTNVAIKVYNKQQMEKTDLENVFREIDIMRQCRHPNIIKLYDVFENRKSIYIVTEYLEGGDMFTYLEKRKFEISEKRACYLIHSLAAALYYLHSFGIIHRDIKPENVLMTNNSENAEAKFCDFGFSKIIGPEEKTTERLGTILYAAPEVILGVPYGKPSDIWGFGMLAHLLLVGYLYYDDEDDSKIMERIINEDVVYPNEYWCKLSEGAKNFVSKCLNKNGKKRINIEDILKHPWILHGNPRAEAARIGCDTPKFAAYTSVVSKFSEAILDTNNS